MLGTYSIDENGDTTLTDYGAYGVENGELKFDQTIKAQPASRPPPDVARPGAATLPPRPSLSVDSPTQTWKPPASPPARLPPSASVR